MRWFERDGGRERLRLELDALHRAGYTPEIDDADPVRLRVRVRVPVAGVGRDMVIVYPEFYPYFRFELSAPTDLGFEHHQHPADGTLCLIDQSTWNWSPSMLAASVIAEQMPKIEAANAATGQYDDEVQTPEPLTHYVDFIGNALVVMPPEGYELPAGRTGGSFVLAVGPGAVGFRGFIEQLDGVATSLPDLTGAFPISQRITGRWQRIGRPKAVRGPDLEQELQNRGVLGRPHLTAKHPIEVTAFLFEDEMAYPRVMGPNWILMVRRRVHPRWAVHLVRVEAFDPEGQAARLRSLETLNEKTVLQVGLGGLGAPAAHLLAQCRIGELRLADFDTVGLGNAVRWPLGFGAAGLKKVDALAGLVRTNYPETTVEPLHWSVGRFALDETGVIEEQIMFERAFADIDAVFDGSAEIGVQQFLAAAAHEQGVPYVMMEATPGAYGGIVARFEAAGACWFCLQLMIRDELIMPPSDAATGTLQLAGCASATFTGAPFDLLPIAAQGVRVLAQLLTAQPVEWNVAVLHNREDDTGALGQTPRWTYHQLGVHPECKEHS